MLRKKTAYIIFFILLFSIYSTYVFGQKSLMFTDDIKRNQELVANLSEGVFRFTMPDNSYLTVLFPDTNSISVQGNNTCKQYQNYIFCINDSVLWQYNYTINQEFHRGVVTLYKESPKNPAVLGLSRIVTNTNPLIGENVQVHAKIKNSGKHKATKILYLDSIPSSLELSGLTGCESKLVDGNAYTIKWLGELQINEEHTCTYNFKPSIPQEFSSRVNLDYYNGIEMKDIEEDVINYIVPNSRLGLTYNIAIPKIKIDEEFDINFTISNDYEKRVNIVSFKIDIPLNFDIVEYQDRFKKNFNQLSWSDFILENSSIDFHLRLKGRYLGNFSISPKLTYIISGQRNEYEREVKFELVGEKLLLNSRFPDQVQGNLYHKLPVEIINPSPTYSFRELIFTITSSIPGFRANIPISKIDPLKTIRLSNIEIPATNPIAEGNQYISMKLMYKSQYGQTLESKDDAWVEILGIKSDTLIEQKDVGSGQTPDLDESEQDDTVILGSIDTTESLQDQEATAKSNVEDTKMDLSPIGPIQTGKSGKFSGFFIIVSAIEIFLMILVLTGIILLKKT
jgi:uncharacterized repeat protein (TIGR01451 family)